LAGNQRSGNDTVTTILANGEGRTFTDYNYPDQVSFKESPKMSKNLLKVLPLAAFIALSVGCVSTADLDSAKATAAQAQKTADEAKTSAASAEQTAQAAQATANQALQTANEAKMAADEANTKLDRAFKKSMHK
jgi:murein lipoprotein